MNLHSAFLDAMAASLLEYREAKDDILQAMADGEIDGPVWRKKQRRLEQALEIWIGLPRRYYGTNEPNAG